MWCKSFKSAGLCFCWAFLLCIGLSQAEDTPKEASEGKEDALAGNLRQAWALLEAGNLDATVQYIDHTLPSVTPAAVGQARAMKGFAPKGKEVDYHQVNVAGTLSYIKALAYQKAGKREEWLTALRRVWSEFPFCQAWDQNGWFWKPGQAAKKEGYMEEIRDAVKGRKLTKSPFPELEDVLDYPQMSIALAAVASKTMEEGDFASLEYLAARMQEMKLCFPDGDSVLPVFFTAAGGAAGPQKDPASWELTVKRLMAWQKSHPDSVLPRIADAHRLIQYGWSVRGPGFSDTVKKEAWPVFEEKLRQAETVLDQCPRSCAHWYVERLTVAFSLGAPLVERKRIFEEGWKAYPGYLPLLNAMVTSLLPRWGGQPEDAMSFAGHLGKTNGAASYTRAINEMWEHDHDSILADSLFDAELYHKGWKELQQDHPGSLILAHRCLVIAISMGDAKLAKTAYKLAGDRYHPHFWKEPYDYLENRRIALDRKE